MNGNPSLWMLMILTFSFSLFVLAGTEERRPIPAFMLAAKARNAQNKGAVSDLQVATTSSVSSRTEERRSIPASILAAKARNAQNNGAVSDPQVVTTSSTSSPTDQQSPILVARSEPILNPKRFLNQLTEEKYEGLLGRFLDTSDLGVLLCESGFIENFFIQIRSDDPLKPKTIPLLARLYFDLNEYLKSRSPDECRKFKNLFIAYCQNHLESIFTDSLICNEKRITESSNSKAPSEESINEMEQLNKKKKGFLCIGCFVIELFKRDLINPSPLLKFVESLLTAYQKAPSEIFISLVCDILKGLGHPIHISANSSLRDKLDTIFVLINGMKSSKVLLPRDRAICQDLIELRKAGWVKKKPTPKSTNPPPPTNTKQSNNDTKSRTATKETPTTDSSTPRGKPHHGNRSSTSSDKAAHGTSSSLARSPSSPDKDDAQSSSPPYRTQTSSSRTSKRSEAMSTHGKRNVSATSGQSSSSNQQISTGHRAVVTPNSSDRASYRPSVPSFMRASRDLSTPVARAQIAPTSVNNNSNSRSTIIPPSTSSRSSLSSVMHRIAATLTPRKPIFKLDLGSNKMDKN